MSILKQRSDGQILYCVAFLVNLNGNWEAKFEYTHGYDSASVLNAFGRSLPRGWWIGGNVRITGCAPVVGYNLVDEKKGIVSV